VRLTKDKNEVHASKIAHGKKSAQLPLKQRLYMEYKPLLYDLSDRYPSVSLSIGDKVLEENLYGVFEKIGFSGHFHPIQEAKSLVPHIVQWLNAKHLVLLHYKPKYSVSTLINILRQVKTFAPAVSLEDLVPIFLKSVSTKQQLEIFKLLGNFGIRYAMFLTPNASSEKNVEELLEGLVDFSDFLKEKTSEVEKEIIEDHQKSTGKIDNYSGLTEQGEELFKKGHYEEAIAIFTKAIEAKPNFKTYMQRGDSFFKSKKFGLALSDYHKANELEQSAPKPFARISACCFALVKIKLKSNNPQKAKEFFSMGLSNLEKSSKLIEKNLKKNAEFPEKTFIPPYEPILNALAESDIRGLGLLSEEKKLNELTAKYLDKAGVDEYEREDISLDAKIDRAVLLARGAHYTEAEKLFRDVISKDPIHAGPAFNNFAIELRKNGQIEKSFEIYKELLQFNVPDREIVLENLKTAGFKYAEELRDKCRLDDAVTVYKRILSYSPSKQEWILCHLASTYLALKDNGQASFRVMEALCLNPNILNESGFKKFKELSGLVNEMSDKLKIAGSTPKPPKKK